MRESGGFQPSLQTEGTILDNPTGRREHFASRTDSSGAEGARGERSARAGINFRVTLDHVQHLNYSGCTETEQGKRFVFKVKQTKRENN